MNKILFVTDEFLPFPGGIARYCGELACLARREGWGVSVVAPSEPPLEYRQMGIRFYILKPSIIPGLWWLKRILLLAYLLTRSKWTLVHAVDVQDSLLLSLLSYVRCFPWIASVHGTDIADIKKSTIFKLLGRGRPYRGALGVVANSHFTARLLEDSQLASGNTRIHVAHLGVSSRWASGAKPTGSCTVFDKLRIPKESKIVLTVARIERRKGHLAAIACLNRVWGSGYRDFCYVLVGRVVDAEYYAEVTAALAEANFQYRHAGVVSDEELGMLYGKSAVFLMPGAKVSGRVEGFGLSYLEASLCGVPSVAYAVDAVPEVISHAKNGFLVKYGDVDQLASEVTKVLNFTEEESFAMSGECISHARQFTWTSCFCATYRSYISLEK